jgi:hypothetical protein
MSNDDERTLLTKQLNNLNKNDILIADRGYYSKELINKLNEYFVNFTLRITKHNKYYIDNIELINKSNDGFVDIDNLRLYWYKTRVDVDKDINKLLTTIKNKNSEINELNNLLSKLNSDYDKLHNDNKEIISKINKNKKIVGDKKKIDDKKKNKLLTKKLEENRLNKNEIDKDIELNKKKIKILKEDLNKLYSEKKEIELNSKSSYLILTNMKTLSIDNIKEIYKKRWEVETHFKYAKELFKFDSMNNKNYEYIKQNILVTQFTFIVSGYIQYILSKKIAKGKAISNTSLFTSLKNKLVYYILNDKIKDRNTLIVTLLKKLLKSIIKKITLLIHKERIRKRPQKNHNSTNIV